MATISWKTGLNGSWDTAASWSGGVVPDGSSTVVVNAAGSYIIAMTNAESVASLTLNAAGAEIADSSGQVFSVGSSMTITAGTFALSSSSLVQAAGAFRLSAGGTLLGSGGNDQITAGGITLLGQTTVSAGILGLNGGGSIGGALSGTGTLELGSGAFTLASGVSFGSALGLLDNGATLATSVATTLSANLQLIQDGTLSVAKSGLTLNGGLAIGQAGLNDSSNMLTGPGTLTTSGMTEINASTAPELILGGGLTWMNTGTVHEDGSGGFTGARIVNAASGHYDFTSDGTTLTADGTAGNLFSNLGTLIKSGGTGLGVSEIDATFNNTGLIEIDTGTLTLTGGGSIAGTVSGAGTLLLTNGSYGIGAASGNGHVVLGAGSSLGFLVTELVATPFVFDDNVGVSVANGATVTLSGAVTIGDTTGGIALAGPGTLVTTGITTINDVGNTPVLEVQGGITWLNSSTGTVNDSGLGYIGTYAETGTDVSAVINNGVFNFIGDDANLLLDTRGGGNPLATFANAGTLAKTSGTGTSTLGAAINDTGTISVASGVLALSGGGNVSGALSGAGSLALTSGTFTTGGLSGAGTLFLGGPISLTGTTTSTIADSLGADGHATLAVAAAKTLTLSGPVGIGDSTGGLVLAGPGTLATTGTTTVHDAGNTPVLEVQGGVTWLNSSTGTVNDSGQGYIGTYAETDTDVSAIVNNGVFNFIGDDANLLLDTRGGGTPLATFANAGTLAKTSGTGTSTLGAVINDTGTISVASGVLALSGGGNVSGALSGAGSLALTSGAFTTGGLTGAGTLFLGGPVSLTGTTTSTITDTVGANGYAILAVAAAKTLTLSGPVSIGDSVGGLVLAGPGTLATTGTTTVHDAGNTPVLQVQGGVTWLNSSTGTVNDSGQGYIGTYAETDTDVSAIVNNGVFNFIGDHSNLLLETRGGGAPLATFANAGTLAKTSGTGTSTLGAVINDTGTISVAAGVLALTAGGVVNGVLSGAGSLALTAGSFTTGGLSGAGTLFLSGATSLTATATATIADSLGANGDATLAVAAAKTLTLSGPVGIGDSTGGLVLGGPGTLATSGITTIHDAGSTIVLQVQGGVTWANSSTGTINDSGQGYIGTYAETDADVSTITNSGLFDLIGGDASLLLDTRGGGAPLATFANKGLLEKTGAGTGSIGPGITFSNTGTIEAASGTLVIASGITGAGTLKIDAGATLEIAAAQASQSVTFTGGNGATLRLDAPASRALAGFTAGDRLDIATNPVTSATISGTTLKVVTSAGTYSYTSAGLAGFYAGVVSDGAGGSLVTIDRAAVPTHSPEPLAFGNHHVGDSSGTTLALTVSNTANADGYSERLNAGFAGATGGFTAAGTITGIAGGASNASALTAVLDTSTAGTETGTATLTLASNGSGLDSRGITALPSQTVNLTGAVYNYAAAQVSNGGTVNLGVIHAGMLTTGALSLANTAAAGAYSEALDARLSSTSAGLSATGAISGLLAGSSDSSDLLLGVNTTTTGAYSGSATLGLASDGTAIGDGLGTTTLAGQTITVLATVDNYALAAFEDPSGPVLTGTSMNETLNLGSVAMGGSALTAALGVLNGAAGLSDLLVGTISTAGGTGFTNTGFGAFGGLGAGQDEHAQMISLSTGSAGVFTETILLSSSGTNASGYAGALATETLTVTGTIVATAFTTYTLDSGPNIIVGADGRGDLFVASGGSLNSRDQLTGGNGANTLTMTGGGTFDINALKTFTNIPTLKASEGQAASGTLASTLQTVLLTDIANENLTVAAGTAAAGNTGAESIRIYGSSSTNTIKLASGVDKVMLANGHDTITLGGATNSVTAGSGTALIRSTAAFAHAAVIGDSAATTTLEVTTGGASTLNAADTFLTVQLDAAGTLKLSAMAFISAIGSAGNDSITALGGTQTLTGGLGIDALTGYTGGNDMFTDTAAGLNGDTIHNWTTGDIIDLTNIAAASLHALSFAANTLTVSDGTTSSAIKFVAGQATHDFTVLGADAHGGTMIGYHP